MQQEIGKRVLKFGDVGYIYIYVNSLGLVNFKKTLDISNQSCLVCPTYQCCVTVPLFYSQLSRRTPEAVYNSMGMDLCQIVQEMHF